MLTSALRLAPLLATATTVLAAIAPAAVAQPRPLHGTIAGTAHMNTQNIDAPIDPGTLTGTFDPATGAITGTMWLPPLVDHGHQFGLFPYTSSNIRIHPDAPATGHVDAHGLTMTQRFHLEVPEVRPDWLPFWNMSTPTCRTADESLMTLTAPGVTDPRQGFTATGAFDMGRFTGCGPAMDEFFSSPMVMSSPANPVTLTFTPTP
ncbi:hypothetical protein K7711_46110 [Nocardia sp. CA2R105]|uniref:hypothetical protein n=1 Tax=Nocardia coffeae TaxID=2873381 RepID=UPI001CA69218|nr:hypothetical protein [Nocardia coffeae]MBY8863907.1 hypothetical protein [Nocardia coffeae]